MIRSEWNPKNPSNCLSILKHSNQSTIQSTNTTLQFSFKSYPYWRIAPIDQQNQTTPCGNDLWNTTVLQCWTTVIPTLGNRIRHTNQDEAFLAPLPGSGD